MKTLRIFTFISLMLIAVAVSASSEAFESILVDQGTAVETSTLGEDDNSSSYSITGAVKINPTNDAKNSFEMQTPTGLINIEVMRSRGSSYTYRGVATEIKIKPHTGGNSIVLDGWSVDLSTSKNYTITSNFMMVFLHNVDGEGSNEGHWWLEIEAEEALMDPAPMIPSDNCISCVAVDDPNAPRGEDYYSYVFEFENGESVSGTSEDKDVIVQVANYEMTLKVDCSDEFKNGYGEKKDPSGDEEHPRVTFYQLWEYKIDVKKGSCKLLKQCTGAPEFVDGSEDGSKKVLRIGPQAGVNDGVQFYNKDHELVTEPKQFEQGDKIDIHVVVVNTTNQDAYLIGWFDANGNDEIEAKEVFLDKKVDSTKELETILIKDSFKIPKEKKDDDDDDDDDDELDGSILQFDLLNAKFLLISKSQFKGINSDGQGNGFDKKENDMMFQATEQPDATIMSNLSDEEQYLTKFDGEEPVAVTLSSFNVIQVSDGVKLVWNVESEMNHAGYNIYRSMEIESGYEKINETIILGWDGFSSFDGTYEYVDKVSGNYFYKLEAVENDGSTELFGPYSMQSTTGVSNKLDMPETFELKQNYPNPFNPSTTITFSLAEPTNVAINIFDMTGRMIRTLIDGDFAAGSHNVVWNAVDGFGETLPTGIYFYTMKTDNFTATRSMTITK